MAKKRRAAGSKPGRFDVRKDGLSILKGTAIAAAGAGLTYFSEWVADADFGQWTATVVAFFTVAISTARKFLTDTRESDGTATPVRWRP